MRARTGQGRVARPRGGRRLLALFLTGCTVLTGCGQEAEVETPATSAGPMTREVPRGTETAAEATPSASSQPALAKAAAREERVKIVAFGDSLTAGFGVSAAESYPAQLQRRLDAAGYRCRVINAGVSGETTAGGLRRVDWVLKSQPDIVILELGANDGLRGLDPAQIRANLEQIIKKLKAAGVRVVLAGMKLPPNYGVEYTSRFEEIYPKLAMQYDLAYMPFFLEGVGAQPTLNQTDGIHPTAQGYEIIVRHLMPVLEPLLEGQA